MGYKLCSLGTICNDIGSHLKRPDVPDVICIPNLYKYLEYF